MKTLDEVIAELEDEGLFADALHHLKEYRSDKAMWEADRKGYQGFVDSYIKSRDKHQAAVIELKHKEKEVNDILTDYVALKQYWAEQQENPPLTWDELCQMEGKPVWIDSVPLVRRWVIIKKFHPIGGNHNLFDMEVEDGAHFLKKSMGRNTGAWWQAYRKERG